MNPNCGDAAAATLGEGPTVPIYFLIDRPRLKQSGLAMLLTALALTSCSSHSTTTSSGPTPSISPPATTSRPAPETSSATSASHPIPAILRGTWKYVGLPKPTQYATFTATSFAFYNKPGDAATGPASVDGNLFTFGMTAYCNNVSVYRWSLRAGRLTFHVVTQDSCPRSDNLGRHALVRATPPKG